MTVLNTVLGAFTGPRRLRSALRRKTVGINSLLIALDGPAELRVQIPAAVFGGDIFGVMSSQLRDALIVAQSAPAPQLNRERRRLNALSATPTLPDPPNPFPLISQLSNPTTQWSTYNSDLTRTSLALSDDSIERSAIPFSPPEIGISPKRIGAGLLRENSGRPLKPSFNSPTSATINPSPEAPASPAASALVSSLNRYWQTVREGRDARHAQPQAAIELPGNMTGFHVAESQQRTSPRAWPTSVGRDVADKLRSFTNTTNPFQKPVRLSSTPERQIQNVFNIEVNHANQHSANFDDLGDRIAQILHEQALQHGIDVT